MDKLFKEKVADCDYVIINSDRMINITLHNDNTIIDDSYVFVEDLNGSSYKFVMSELKGIDGDDDDTFVFDSNGVTICCTVFYN